MTTRLHPVPKLRMYEATPQLPQYIFTAWCLIMVWCLLMHRDSFNLYPFFFFYLYSHTDWNGKNLLL